MGAGERAGAAPDRSVRRLCTNVFLLAFLGVQLALPVRGFVKSRFESRGEFSWNMYSLRYRCERSYTRISASGERTPIPTRDILRRRSRRSSLDARERLPRLHAWICDREREDPSDVIHAKLWCSLHGGEPVALVDPEADICGASQRVAQAP